MLEAVLFDWTGTLCTFEWDDELLAAGHRAGLEALGRVEEADELTAGFRERLPALLAEQGDCRAELRDLLAPVDDAAVRKMLLEEYSIEIGGGLGPLAGKIWRVGLMGNSSASRLVVLLLGALQSALAKQRVNA